MTSRRLLQCTVKTCGQCAGARCALGVDKDVPLEKVVCPWQRTILEVAKEGGAQ